MKTSAMEKAPTMMEQIENILRRLNMRLREENASVELLGIDEGGVARVRANNLCGDCPMSIVLFQLLMLKLFRKRMPALKKVIIV